MYCSLDGGGCFTICIVRTILLSYLLQVDTGLKSLPGREALYIIRGSSLHITQTYSAQESTLPPRTLIQIFQSMPYKIITTEKKILAWEYRHPFKPIRKSPSKRCKQTSIHHNKVTKITISRSQRRMESAVILSVGLDPWWIESESRFDLFVIGLQRIIRRPELKQHLKCSCTKTMQD